MRVGWGLSVQLQAVPAVEVRGGGAENSAPAVGGEQAERRASAAAASGASGEHPAEFTQVPPALPPRPGRSASKVAPSGLPL